MLEGHISKAFDGALAALHIRVLEMGGLALDQVREAARAYADWDEPTAQRVIDREAAVKAYDTALGDDELTIIARRAPVASDLRAVLGLAKCVAELERVGAEARKIARPVLAHGGRPGKRSSGEVRHLAQLACNMLRLSLEGLDRIDPSVAEDVIARDLELDAEYSAGLRRLMTRAMEDPRSIEGSVETAFALKSLERVGDHARNLARHVQSIAPDAHRTGRTGDPPLPERPPAASQPTERFDENDEDEGVDDDPL
jgi:phosphate transport system protein